MTTTYDTEFSTETIAAPQYDDPDLYTIAEAWASSPLGEMGDDHDAAADTADDRDPAGSRAKLFAALAAGIVIGGATLGAVLFGYRAVAPPTVVVPGFGVSTEQLPAAPTMPNSLQAPQKPAAAQGPASKSRPAGRRTESHCRRIQNERRSRRDTQCSARSWHTAASRPARRHRRLRPAAGRHARATCSRTTATATTCSSTRRTSRRSRFPTSRTRNPQHRRDRGPDARPRATETDGDRPEADRPQRQQMDDEAAPERAGFAESEYEQPRDARQTLTDDCCR